jgi:hypothetical protein
VTGIAVSFPAFRSLVKRGSRLLLLVAAAFAFLSAEPAGFPPIPPLPASSWPAPADAEPFARALLARVSAPSLAHTLAANPELEPAILRNLGTAIVSNDAALRDALGAYLADAAGAAVTTLDVQRLTALAVVDPLRYGNDAAFRARIDALLPRTFAKLPPAAARGVLHEIASSGALDFGTTEAAAAAAHLIAHTSGERRVAFDRTVRLPDDAAGTIDASIFSLNTAAFTPAEALRFLGAVHAASPARHIVVLADAPMRAALAGHRELDLVDDLGRSFTPWPRDPFIAGRDKSGVVFVNRPNAQPGREEDQNMARVLAASLPGAHWTVAPTPFHNGQILRTPDAVWISMHSVEPRALALLGLDRVPAETFGDAPGIARYLGAVKRAARELEELYQTPVRFVHALPSTPDEIARLAGGAGYDLDSIVTLLPRGGGKTAALVGDVNLGAAAARKATSSEWNALRAAYDVNESASAIAGAQPQQLQQFLDEVADELRRDGMTVRRVPLLKMPQTAFMLTANNVVLETRGTVRRAEGFASLLPPLDAAAREAFAASGYRLDLFPPLARSVVRGGGYRCASNHLRNRVGGGVSVVPASLSHHRTYGSVSGGSGSALKLQPSILEAD